MRKITGTILIILIVLICINGVNAENTSITNDSVNLTDNLDDSILDTEENSTITVSHSHTQLFGIQDSLVKASAIMASGGSFKQFKAIIDSASSGDVIQITGDYSYNSDTSFVNTGIVINKKLTIIGNGHTFDGNGVSRIFSITANNVNITGINFVAGCATAPIFDTAYRGGGVACRGTNFYMSYCNFTYCVGEGGAAYCQYGESSANPTLSYVDNCVFMYNTAVHRTGDSQDSIILSVLDGCSVTLTNSIIANNYANSYSNQMIAAMSGIGDKFYNNVIYNNTASGVILGRLKNSNDILYNWYGSNNPDFSYVLQGTTPANWIVMNFTNITPFPSVSTGGSVIFQVLFNRIFVYSNSTYENLTGGIAPRTVKFSDNGVGTFNVTEITFNGECYVTYTFPAGVNNVSVFATIDEQRLKVSYPEPLGSFTELYQLIQATPTGGVLNLTKNFEYEPRWDLPLYTGIPITKAITINGNGYSIGGLNVSRIFKISGNNVNLNNITFMEGYSISSVGGGYYGGAIYNTGNNLNITNCVFTDNRAITSGGAIYSSGSNAMINYNAFVNNTGKIYLAGGNLEYNWWGVNYPTLSNFISSTVPKSYILMNFTNLQPITSTSGTVSLLTTLDTIYNTTSSSYSKLNNSFPSRVVDYTVNSPASLNHMNSYFNGNDTNDLSYSSSLTSLFVTAKVDNQILNISTSDISVTINVSNQNPPLLGIINYIITVKNNGADDARDIKVNFKIPNDFIYINDNSYGNYSNSTGIWSIFSLNNGASRVLNISVRIPYNQSIINQTIWAPVNVSGAYADLNNVNDNSTINITVRNITGGSYTLLQYLIDNTPAGGILNLGFNVTYNPVYDSSLMGGMQLNKSITINGNGYTISGNNTARIFYSSGNDVVLNNIIFTKGCTDGTYFYGAGIYSLSNNLTVNNSTFIDNYVIYRGVIFLNSGKSYFTDCNFINNNINNFVISVESPSTTYVTRCIFLGNTIRDYASAIGLLGSAKAYVNNSVFVDNKGYTIQNNGNGIFENNWWGTNTPNLNNLVDYIPPKTYIIMNFTNITPISYSPDSTTLEVTLNTVYNITSNSISPLVGTLPKRNVTFNWTDGTVSPQISEFTGTTTSTFSYTLLNNPWTVNATIDNQTLWIGSSDIGIYIIPNNNPIDDGKNISYTVVVINNGPMNATNINVTLNLPGLGLVNITVTNNTGVWNNTTNNWYIGDLNVGKNVTLIINGTLSNPGPYLIWNATIVNVTDYYDNNFTNNTFISNVTVNQIADLEIHKNISNPNPAAKDNITYTIVVFNNGPSTATNISVFDNLSSKLIYINSSATKGDYNSTTGVWFMDNMTPGTNETLNITVCVNKSGFTNNFVNVSSLINDTNMTNNVDNISFMTPPLSDLWVTINVEPQTSNYIVYHIQAGNNGIEDANGTVVVFNHSSLYFYYNHTEDKGLYDNATGVWDIGYLEVGEIVNLTLIVRLDFPTAVSFANVTTSVNITSWSTDLYSQNNTDNVTFEAELFGNFRLLQDYVDSWAENTTQILPRSFAYDPILDAKLPGETYDLINGVRLYKNITIVNPLGFTLGGFDMARIFNISANNVVLDSLKFFDGYSPLGGALNIHADNVQVLRSNFSGNWLFGDYGGAIFTSGSNTLIQDNRFWENSASKLGGAIGALGATNLKILNNTFINNSVESDSVFGGAIGIENSSNVVVNGNVFLENKATNAPNLGSAIYTYNSNVDLETNWFGNNTPDMDSNHLIYGVKPETFIVLDWEFVNPNMTGVELNVVFLLYNRTSGSKIPVGYGIPYRSLNVTARDPTLSWYNTTYTGNNSVNYTYNVAIPIYEINATVDNETLHLEFSTLLDAFKVLVNDTIWYGDNLIYNITLVNYGPHNSLSINVTDLLPDNLVINSVSSSIGTLVNTSNMVSWELNIPAGVNVTLIVNTTPVVEGFYTNNLTINTSSVYDYFIHGNCTNATAEVLPLSDLSINITISNPPYYVGEEINYTIVIHNKGPSNATNVIVNIPLPSGLVFMYVWNLDGYIPDYNNVTGVWNVGVLHVNETIEINMTLLLNKTGWYNQTVNISSYAVDINTTNNNDTVSFNVTSQVDLELNMTINKNDTIYGDTNVKITYSVLNKGPSPATNVTVFTVFTGLTYLYSSSGYGIFNNITPFTGYWIVGNLSKGQLVTITLTFNASNLGSFMVTGRANASDNESYWSDNYANVTLDVYEYADLSITKTVSNSTPFLLHNVTYTITVTNNGLFNAYNVTVYDLLPSVLIYNNDVVGFNGSEWFIGTLSPGDSRNISFNVTVDGIGDIWNNVTVNSSTRDSNYNNNHAECVIHVPVADDLRIFINVVPSTPSSDTQFIINITVWNYGYEDNNNVMTEFHIPTGLTYVSATGSGSYSNLNGLWNIGVLGNGQRVNLEIVVMPTIVGNVTLQANVSGQVADVAPWNNRANLTFEIVPSFDLVVTKTANTSSITDGDYITFYITVVNNGPYTANNVLIQDYLPYGVEYLIDNSSGVYNTTTRLVNWTFNSLGVGESRSIELRAQSWGPGLTIINTVTASAYGTDKNITDNTASWTINVTQASDLEIIINASKLANIDLGENITFWVTVINHGPSNQTGVIANFLVPTLFDLISENSTGLYNNLTGDWFIGNLASGENITLELNATLINTGKCTANATVNGTYNDTNLTNNYFELNITATALFDLNITMFWSNNTILWEDISNLTIIVSNKGPDNATNVTVSINVPGLTFIGSNGNFNETLMQWNVGDLNVGEYKNITITFNGTNCGFYLTTGNVSGRGIDNNTTDNNFTINITVQPIVDLIMTNLTVNTTFTGIDSILEFNVTVYNAGPCNATNTTILGLLPVGWFIMGGSTVADIPVNTSHTFRILVNASTDGIFTVGFNATIDGFDTNISNNWMYIGPIEVIYCADLMITIKVSDTTPVTGDIVVYVITVSNLDWRTAHNVTANITIPNNLTLDHYYLASGVYNSSNGTWTIGDLSFRNSTSLFLFCRVNTPGFTSFWVNVTGDDYDFNLENNNDTVSINTANGLDLNITMFTNNNTPFVGDSVNVTVVVENIGNINATGVYVDFNMPNGFVNITSVDLNFTGASWYLGNLTVGTSKVLNFTLTPIILGDLTINSHVSSSKFDYNTSNDYSNLTVSPIGSGDLEINITVNNSHIIIGENVTYAISILNKGLINVDNVFVYNNLPNPVTYDTSIGMYYPISNIWSITNLTPNTIQTLNITINHTTIGTFTYTANITGNTIELNTTNNIDNVTVTIGDYNDLITFFTVSNTTIRDTELLNFTITVLNNGSFNYTGVKVYTDLPLTGLYNGSGLFDTNLGLWDIGNLSSGENKTLNLIINMTSVGNYTYWANATSNEYDRNRSNNNQSLNISVYADYDLTVNITLNNNDTINIGDNLSFTITVSNTGPSTAYNVKVFDNIYGTLESLTKGTYTGNTWNIGTLKSGEVETLNLTLTTTSNGTFNYNVSLNFDNPIYDRNNSNNKDNITLTIINGVDLIITITSNTTLVNKTDTVEIIVTIYNNASNTANNILIDTTNLFDGLSSTPILSTGFLSSDTWFIPTLTGYSNATLNLTKTILNNTLIQVNVTSNNYELDNTSNYANQTINVTKYTDLLVTITTNTTNATIGDNITFTITVYNLGNDTAENVTVYTDLPYSTMYTDVYMYDSLQGIWSIGTLVNGTNRTLNITITLTDYGIITYNTIVNTSTWDINLTNNYDNITLNITNLVDLSINLTLNTTTYYLGDNITFLVNITNYGPGIANNVIVNIPLPGTLTYLTKGTYTGNTWNIGNLNPSESAILNLTHTLTSTDEGIYNLNISSTDYEENLTNNNLTFNLTFNLSSDLEVLIYTVNETNTSSIFNYTVIVLNHGPSNVSTAIVNFTWPNGFNITSNMTSNGIFTRNSWNLTTLNSGDNATLYIYGKYLEHGNKTLEVFVNSTNKDINTSNNYKNISILINSVVDLTVNFTTLGYYNPDGTVTFNITIWNKGPTIANNITIYTNLDTTSYYNLTLGYFDTLQDIWYINTLDTGESATLILNTTAIGGVEYYANVTSTDIELNITDNIKFLNLTLTPLVDLSINITSNTTSLHVGDSVNFTVTVTNLGPYNATGVLVNTNLPSSSDYTLSKGLYDTVNGNWSIGNLSIGENVTLNLILNITGTGEYIYKVNVTTLSNDTNTSNNNDTINLTVEKTSDLSIKILTNTTNPIVGENITILLNLTNNGLDNATNITVEYLFENFTILNIIGTGLFDNNTWNMSSLENNTNLELNITGFFNTNGTLTLKTNTSSIVYDNDTSNNVDSLTLLVKNPFDLEIHITTNNTNIYAGEYVNLLINITNHGPGTSENILINTNILNASSIKPNGYYDKDTGYIFINSLESDTTLIINLTKQIINNNTYFTNITNNDLNTSNNYDNITFNVSPSVDLVLTVTVDNTNPYFNDDLTYIITVTNKGYNTAENVTVNTTLENTGFNFIGANSTNYSNGIWNIGNLNVSETVSLTVSFKTNHSGLITSTFNATTSTFEPNTINNHDNITVNVSSSYKPSTDKVDLIITINTNNTTPLVNETVLFNITVFNNASLDATNLTINVSLPNGLTHTLSGGWFVPNLNSYDNISFTFTVNVTNYGSYVTNTTVDCLELDNNPVNNRANVLIICKTPSTDYTDLLINITRDGNLTVGETFTYNITIINNGTKDAYDINATIGLINGLLVINQSTTDYNNTLGHWNVGNLTPGANKTLTLTINITKEGTYTNIFLVWNNETDTNPQNNLIIDTFEVNDTHVDINIRILANKTYVSNNETIQFTVIVSNPSPNTAHDVNVTLTIPNEFIVNITGNDTNTSYYIGNLSPGSNFTFTFNATLNSTTQSTITVNATLNETDHYLDDNTDTITITPSSINTNGIADLMVNITVNEQYPEILTVPIFNIWVTNKGPDNATNIAIPISVPTNCVSTSVLTPTGSSWDNSTSTFHILNLSVGATMMLEVSFRINNTEPLLFNVTAEGDQFDPNITDNTASISLYPWEATPTCDLNVTIVPIGNEFHANGTVTFNITIRNFGNKTAYNVTVHNIVPAGLTIQSISTTWAYTNITDGWFMNNHPINTNKSFLVTYKIEKEYFYHTTVNVNSTTFDVDPVNNGMGVAIWAREPEPNRRNVTTRITPTVAATTLYLSTNTTWNFKGTLKMANTTTSPTQAFAGQKLYANITKGTFSLTVESIDLTSSTGVANFQVAASQLDGTGNYKVTFYYPGLKTDDTYYLPNSTSQTRKVTINS